MSRLRKLSPATLLGLTMVLTLCVSGWLGWQVYRSTAEIESLIGQDLRLQSLRGTIIYLDEVLTMSARMAALTGDDLWGERYANYVPQLDSAIQEVLALVPTDLRAQIQAETDAANRRLVELETAALADVRDGRIAQAQAALFSVEYDQQKQIYARGMQRLLDFIAGLADQRLTEARERSALALGSLPVILLILVAIWAGALRMLRESLAARDELLIVQTHEQALEEALQDRERAIAARTSELQSALGEVEASERQLRATLDLLAHSQSAVRALSVPVLPITATTLVMPLVGLLDADRLELMQAQALENVSQSRVRTMVLDITGVPVVDSHVAHGIVRLVQSLSLMGVETTLAGIRPEVAQTLVGLGVSLGGLRTYSDLRKALQAAVRADQA